MRTSFAILLLLYNNINKGTNTFGQVQKITVADVNLK